MPTTTPIASPASTAILRQAQDRPAFGRPAHLQLRPRQPAHPGRKWHLDHRLHLPFDRLRASNGAGDRVAKTVDGVTTAYVLDPAAGLTQVLQETTAGQATSYLYGHDLLAQYDSGTWAYHVNDGLGSVRGLADPVGQVVQGYSFDPFGVPLWAPVAGIGSLLRSGAKGSPVLLCLDQRVWRGRCGRHPRIPGLAILGSFAINELLDHRAPEGAFQLQTGISNPRL
jgi:hypothetical protein